MRLRCNRCENLLLLILTCAGVCGSTQVASAQAVDDGKYSSVPIADAYQQSKYVTDQRGKKNSVVLGQASLNDNRQDFTSYYRDYFFRQFTQPEFRSDLPGKRDELKKDLSKAPADVHRYLTDITFQDMLAITKGNFHPAVRFNAMLVIGDLNVQEAQGLPNRTPAEPFPAALDVMLTEFKDPKQIEVVKIAAMIGILRHVVLDRQLPQDQPMPGAAKSEIVQLMRQIVTQGDPPAGRSPEAHAWIQRRAMDILAQVGYVGDDGGVYNEIAAHLDSKDALASLRCTAARSLGDLNYPGITVLEPVPSAQKLAAFAVEFCRAEDKRIEAELKQETEVTETTSGFNFPGLGGGESSAGPGYGSDGAGPGYGGGIPGMPGFGAPTEEEKADPKLTLARRRLKYALSCVLYGLRGEKVSRTFGTDPTVPLGGVILMSQTPDHVQEVNKIVAAVEAVLDATDPPSDDSTTFNREELMKQLRTKLRDLEALLPQPEEPAPAAASDVPGGDVPGGDVPGGPPADPDKGKADQPG